MTMLAGLRIIEIEGLGPAPFAAMHLADLGAEVITIHRPTAATVTTDPSLLDRGKRSITLDLKDPEDLSIAQDLIATADALIEGFRPGVMERLGLGPKECHARNPKLVYGRMTGWGQTGPRAHTAGHDLNYVAQSGALWYASDPGTPPLTPATLVGDIGGGALYLVIGLLAGLLNARATGHGTVVDAAIVDGSAHMMTLLMALGQAGGLSMTRGNSLLDGPHWSRCYACADGAYISVQALEPQFYATLLAKLDLSEDPEFAQQHNRTLWPQLTTRLADLFRTQPRAHWEALFDGSDACVAAVLSPKDSARAPHMMARGIWQHVDGALQAAPAPRFDGPFDSQGAGIGHTPKPAPKRGADRAAILAELRNGQRPPG